MKQRTFNQLVLALNLLDEVAGEFPEHDQVDFRVWQAAELIRGIVASKVEKEEV